MIKVSRLNKEELYLNPMLIEKIEKMPDTLITMINGNKYIVAESVPELTGVISAYYKEYGLIPPQIVFHSYDFSDG